MKPVLADVNIWLATLVAEHPHHDAVKRWWQEDVLRPGDSVAFCRLTQLGLLRLLCNDRVMGRQRLGHVQAWEAVARVNGQANVLFLDEPSGLDDALAGMCSRDRSSTGFWSDAYLAAFARAGEHRFATFDRGFVRFDGLNLVLLES